MEHPLIKKDQLDLRKRVVQLLKESYSSLNTGNIVFVCGGNDATHMRILFREYCRNHKPNYQIFLPEYAIKNYFSEVTNGQFDIADFEKLIGELSHAIVVFPEAPGSFAEIGYFSAVEELRNKIVLSLDAQFQGGDSFISLGPAKKIDAKSQFSPTIQTNYTNPNFEEITKRIERFSFPKKRKQLEIDKYNQLSEYDLFCLIYQIFNLLKIATYKDLKFIIRSIFKNQFKENRLKQLTSVLVGSNLLLEIGDFGHYCVRGGHVPLLEIVTGHAEKENSIKLELTDLLLNAGDAFIEILETSRNAS